MKNLGFLFILLAFNGFAQKEIFLQTNPDDQYVIAYSTNSYIMLFGYQDVLDAVRDPELKTSIKELIDNKLSTRETFELNKKGQVIFTEDDELDLKEFMERRVLGKLLSSGKAMIMDPYGKPTVSSLLYTRESVDENGYESTYTDATTGQKIFISERGFRMTGCPSF